MEEKTHHGDPVLIDPSRNPSITWSQNIKFRNFLSLCRYRQSGAIVLFLASLSTVAVVGLDLPVVACLLLTIILVRRKEETECNNCVTWFHLLTNNIGISSPQ